MVALEGTLNEMLKLYRPCLALVFSHFAFTFVLPYKIAYFISKFSLSKKFINKLFW